MDTFLAHTNLRSLLPHPELTKDVRINPFGIELVVPSQPDAQEFLATSQLLQPPVDAVSDEKHEIRDTYLLGPAPKY